MNTSPNRTIEAALPARGAQSKWAAALLTFLLTAGILSLARWKAPFPILLADRFLPGSGWIQILLLAIYGVLLINRMADRRDTAGIRLKIWLTFSVVFFAQFILGVAGLEKLLMTGRLHVPVPAVVIAGPIFRGERFFMPILFVSTIILVGPAWCSHLCYIGAWDGLAATARRRGGSLSSGWTWLRFAVFAATPVLAVLLRFFKVSGLSAGIIATGFGALGLAVMAGLSTRRGVMVHCTAICPLGLASNLLGRVSPFRIRIGPSCTDCGRCTASCRYNALSAQRIAKRRPGYTCTLCGDCIASCETGALGYTFFRASPSTSRLIFLVLAVSLHAVFLGVARI
jgi:polyferredoxin